MHTLLNRIYYKLRKEEIAKAQTRLKMIKIDNVMESLIKLCWKYNIQYKLIIKTNDMLIIKLTGNMETALLKYHKTDMVSKNNVDFFMSEIDEGKISKGVYITTGQFEKKASKDFKTGIVCKRDFYLEDGFSFIKRHLGFKGRAVKVLTNDNLNFFKYLPQ